jgi:hypothetical protein
MSALRGSSFWTAMLAAWSLAILAGCNGAAEAPAPSSEPGPSVFAPDETGSRLQEMGGSLLLFRGSYGRMPESLQELKLATGLADQQIIDPATGAEFVYSPTGLAAGPAQQTIFVLAAPAPGADVCQGLSLDSGPGGLRTDVVTFPAEAYEMMKPAASTPAGRAREQ